VNKQQDDFAQKDQDEKLLEIESELRAMLDVQLGVNKTTDELDKIASGGKELGRKEKLDLDKITGDEKGVSEKSSEIQKKLDEEKIPVYAWVMADVSKDTNAVTSMLSRSDTGPVTKQVEANVVANLKDLIDALQRQRMQNQKAGGGGGGGGGGGKSRLVPPLAEVKMIKAMHQRASSQTHELDEMIRSGKVKGDDANARVGELAGKESQIGKLLQDLLDALTAPPDEPKDK
jgi:hypothetical protein